MTADDDIDDSEVNVPGCNIIRCDAENRYIRRIMLYVRSDIKHEIILKTKIISNSVICV